MSATSLTEWLADSLSWRGREVVATTKGLEVRRWDDGPLDPPLPITLDDTELRAAIGDVDSATKKALWPGRSDEFVAFALISVHLDELIATRRGSGGRLHLHDGQLDWATRPTGSTSSQPWEA